MPSIRYADLHGIDPHGRSMLRKYHRDLQSGALIMKAKVEVVREGPSTALLDGGGGRRIPPTIAQGHESVFQAPCNSRQT